MSFNSTHYNSPSGGMSIDDSPGDRKSPNYVTFRKGVAEQDMMILRNDFLSFQESIKIMMSEFLEKQDTKFTKIINDFEELKNSIKFVNHKYEELKVSTDETRNRVSVLEDRCNTLQNKASLIMELEGKIDILELNARQCNIEINNLPERRDENLFTIIENIASAIKHPISKTDIVVVNRVPQMNSSSGRPKNIIVKFSSRIVRDNFLAAARLAKGLTSAQLQLAGTSNRIYINEHLTLKKKSLFREVREAAKEKGIKYVWVKHGVILVRASDTSPVHAVRSKDDLSKIKTKTFTQVAK